MMMHKILFLVSILCLQSETSWAKTLTHKGTEENALPIAFDVTKNSTNVTCGGSVDGTSGVLESPNFPSHYPNNQECEWIIRAEGEAIRLDVLSFDLECCCYDFVEIRNGPSSSSPLLARLCDPTNVTSIQTSSNAAYVRFSSDHVGVNNGFQIYWEATGIANTTTPFPTTTLGPTGEAHAFSVSLSYDTAIDNSPLVFDEIIYNQQQLFNPISGVFEVRVRGLYFLTTSCLSTRGTSFHVYIMRGDDDILCKSQAADLEAYVGTCSVVTELYPGELVRVTGSMDHVGVVMGDGFSSFSGYLIART